jgi:hypothetical protein
MVSIVLDVSSFLQSLVQRPILCAHLCPPGYLFHLLPVHFLLPTSHFSGMYHANSLYIAILQQMI